MRTQTRLLKLFFLLYGIGVLCGGALLITREGERVTGAVLGALGCALLPLAGLGDRDRKFLGTALWSNFVGLLFLASMAARTNSSGKTVAVISVFSLVAVAIRAGLSRQIEPEQTLRTTYEEQIRQAAGQEERNRLARDLHDSVRQQIFAIQTSAAAAQARFDSDPAGARTALENVRSSAREAVTEMDAMLDQLRAIPFESMGLVAALRKQCEALEYRSGAHVELKFSEVSEPERLPPGAAQSLFRIAQEALANVARHARATEVKLRLEQTDGNCVLRIQDNGSGFAVDAAAAGMGLSNMRSRAAEHGGSLIVRSAPGEGTEIRLTIPLVRAAVAHSNRKALRNALIMGAVAVGAAAISFGLSNEFLAGLARGLSTGLFCGCLAGAIDWFRS